MAPSSEPGFTGSCRPADKNCLLLIGEHAHHLDKAGHRAADDGKELVRGRGGSVLHGLSASCHAGPRDLNDRYASAARPSVILCVITARGPPAHTSRLIEDGLDLLGSPRCRGATARRRWKRRRS